jgi:hypothetical protein
MGALCTFSETPPEAPPQRIPRGYAAVTFNIRCILLMEEKMDDLLREAPEAQTERVASTTRAISEPEILSSQPTRAASLAKVGKVSKARKVAFSYGLGRDPIVAAIPLQAGTQTETFAHPAVCIQVQPIDDPHTS